MKNIVPIVVAVSGLFWGVTGCRNEGPLERAGEQVDEAVDNVKDGQSPFHKKGPAERAGEAVDDAADRVTR